tara:strand:+ start:858 stop:1073 length:216 start_codon:yes stop_codon:yes gene_type:complete
MIGKIIAYGFVGSLGFFGGCQFGQYYNENYLRYVVNPEDGETYKINFEENKLESLIEEPRKMDEDLRRMFR